MAEDIFEGGAIEVEFAPVAARQVDDDGQIPVDLADLVYHVESMQFAVPVQEQRTLLQKACYHREHH